MKSADYELRSIYSTMLYEALQPAPPTQQQAPPADPAAQQQGPAPQSSQPSADIKQVAGHVRTIIQKFVSDFAQACQPLEATGVKIDQTNTTSSLYKLLGPMMVPAKTGQQGPQPQTQPSSPTPQ